MTDSDSRTDDGTERARRTYDRVAKTYDVTQRLPEILAFGRLRRELWSRIGPGSVLEVGVGTGASFEFYPRDRTVTAIDLSEGMLARARSRAGRDGVDVDLRLMDAQALDFPDPSFDWVVSCFVFCSVPDPLRGLSEVRRFLRPGGRALFLEHVRSELPLAGPLMDLLNPIPVRLTGANINRRTVENIRRAGFEVLREDRHMLGVVRVVEANERCRLTDTIEVTLVTGWGCKPCDKVKQRLKWLTGEFPEMHVSELDIGTEEGTRLAIRYKLAGLPGILINGHMALVGDVSPELLRERLMLARQSMVAQA